MFVRYILAVQGKARQVRLSYLARPSPGPFVLLHSPPPPALGQNQQTLEGAKRIVAEGVRVTENEEEAKLVPHLSLSPTPTSLITTTRTRTDHSLPHTGHDATQSRQDADQGHDISQTRINPTRREVPSLGLHSNIGWPIFARSFHRLKPRL